MQIAEKLYQWACNIGMPIASLADGRATVRHVRQHLAHLTSLPPELQQELARAEYQAFSRSSPAPPLPPSEPLATLLATVELDSFVAGMLLARIGCTPAVMNMANESHCGGAWTHCRGSQEECLFHRSSLPLSLWPRRTSDDTRLYGLLPLADDNFYPFSEAGVVYSPRVLVTRDERNVLMNEEQWGEVAVLSIAAQDLRWWTPGTTAFDDGLTREKARSLLYTAATRGHDTLVLGALGAGAFKNEPGSMAALFADLLRNEFAGRFRVVVFAVIFSQRNLDAFAAHFPLVLGATPQDRAAALEVQVRGDPSKSDAS